MEAVQRYYKQILTKYPKRKKNALENSGDGKVLKDNRTRSEPKSGLGLMLNGTLCRMWDLFNVVAVIEAVATVQIRRTVK